MKLDVPLHKQKRKDMACGFICLQMVLDYYGTKLSYDKILKLAKIDKYFGCWWAQMASVAIDLGYKTEFVNYNMSNIYDADIIGLKGKKLIGRLKKQKKYIDEKYWPEIDYDVKMIEKGGELNLKIPKKEDLISWLKQGIPPIITVKFGPAYGKAARKRRMYDQHGLVVHGYDGKNFLVHDPRSTEWALKKLPEDLLMFSWYEGKALTLLVKPK